jgi:hypothetical protein
MYLVKNMRSHLIKVQTCFTLLAILFLLNTTQPKCSQVFSLFSILDDPSFNQDPHHAPFPTPTSTTPFTIVSTIFSRCLPL